MAMHNINNILNLILLLFYTSRVHDKKIKMLGQKSSQICNCLDSSVIAWTNSASEIIVDNFMLHVLSINVDSGRKHTVLLQTENGDILLPYLACMVWLSSIHKVRQ